MPLIGFDKDLDALTTTVRSEFDATVERTWQLWADPRQLERWWGPPTFPATVEQHDLVPGGSVTYFMSGPEGERYAGWWDIRSVDAPKHLEFEDGFADEHGNKNLDMPTTISTVEITERRGGGSEMRISTRFPSSDAMEQMLEMGMVEGMTEAVGQIDAILADVGS